MPKLYGSVNGQSKEIKKLYGSISGQTKKIKKLYGSAPKRRLDSVTGTIRLGTLNDTLSFDSSTFVSAAAPLIDENKTLRDLQITRYGEGHPQAGTYILQAIYTNNTYTSLGTNISKSDVADFGIIMGDGTNGGQDFIDLTPVYSFHDEAVLIYQHI